MVVGENAQLHKPQSSASSNLPLVIADVTAGDIVYSHIHTGVRKLDRHCAATHTQTVDNASAARHVALMSRVQARRWNQLLTWSRRDQASLGASVTLSSTT